MSGDDRKKYLEDGKWGCLGCGYTLYPSGAHEDYCANVRCPLRHPEGMNSDNVRRLVDRVLEVERQRDEIGQGVEDLIAVAKTDEDSDGHVTAYHFRTGALHRLLGLVRQVCPGVRQTVGRRAG